MDELNNIIQKYIDEIECYDPDTFIAIKKLSEIILSCREPNFMNKIKNSFGLSKSKDLSEMFFYDLDKEYGLYFTNILNNGTFIFNKVKSNSDEIAGSDYDYTNRRKKIYLPYRNNIADSFSIVHETLHDMNLDINNLSLTRHIFTEYISMYGEFLFEEYIDKNFQIKCKAKNNYSFDACFLKALKVDLQINLIKCIIENGYISDYNLEMIIKQYNKRYHRLLLTYCDKIVENKKLDFTTEMRYLYGILLSCYSKYNKIDKEIFTFINDNINDMEIDDIFSILNLGHSDEYLMLSNDANEELNKCYIKVMNGR